MKDVPQESASFFVLIIPMRLRMGAVVISYKKKMSRFRFGGNTLYLAVGLS